MVITVEEDFIRLDNFFKKKFDYLSRVKIQEILQSNLCSFNLNGDKVNKISQSLRKGDSLLFDENLFIIVNEKEKEIYQHTPSLNILYEDDYILIIDKEQGVCCHHSPGQESGTLEDSLFFRLDEKKREELKDSHFGLVHRLDKDTSGLLLVAKDKESLDDLQNQFKQRSIYKEYVAYALGMVLPKSFSIETGIRRSLKDRKKFETCSLDEGRFSKTDVEVLEYLKDKFSFLKLVLHTGRTHQIRVHLLSISHPIVCDPLYSRKKKEFSNFTMMLHSKVLEFKHPKNKRKMHFESTLPERFSLFKEFIYKNS